MIMNVESVSEKKTIKVLIVDDQSLVRQGMASLLAVEEDLEVIGQAENGEEAILKATQLSPDVILMDVRMPVADGILATSRIRDSHPNIRVIVLTTFDDEDYIIRALQVGAAGYLLKDTPSEQLAQAVRAVYQGHAWLGPTVATKVVSRLQSVPKTNRVNYNKLLTTRELEVLRLIGKGKSNREIANALCITEGTVKNHVTRVLTQIGARDRTQAALWAMDNLDEQE
jgi:DNA-binding NarL/FixJ family response regulator